MCRWVAYVGEPVYLCSLICDPEHSLIDQSINAREAKTGINGDGFGLGWYGERPEPGLYREVLPAWSDENLRHIARQVRSRLFFAHVRASTGAATSRTNCHPFTLGKWLFMHNGQIGDYCRVRRAIEGWIPDELYNRRTGSTDSEALFLAASARGLETDPVGAIRRVLADTLDLMRRNGVTTALRFTAALTDGERIYAFRTASDEHSPSLYWRTEGGATYVVSEPLDDVRDSWSAVPSHHVLIAERDGQTRIESFDIESTALAA